MDINLLESKIVSIDTLEPNKGQLKGVPKNPRFIRDEAFLKLKNSIQQDPEMLAMREILVYPHNDKYVIIGGNMRYRALLELGEKQCIVKIIPSFTTADQLARITLKDNSGFGEWDFDLLANEWDKELVEDCCIELPGIDEIVDNPTNDVQEDEFDENEDEVETVCKPGDIWSLGEHRLMCGDSTNTEDVQALMAGETADLWLTDPPYNVAVKNSQGMTIANDNMKSDDFLKFLKGAFAAAEKVLRPGCAFYVWFASCEHINFETALNSVGLKVRQELIWNKNHFILGRQDYQWKHEPALYGWKDGAAHYFIDVRNNASVIPDEAEIDIDKMKKDEMAELLHKIYDGSHPTTIIDENKPTCDADHPTMKPVKLFGRLIYNSSRSNDIVLDTFGGSGTTMIACEQLKRKARLMELDPHYCDVIIARWEKLTNKQATRISTKSNN